jgi:hypothetical protein
MKRMIFLIGMINPLSVEKLRSENIRVAESLYQSRRDGIILVLKPA